MRKLIQAVINQHDANAEEFLEMCKDVQSHGAEAGFSGFIYYTETAMFFVNNKDVIMEEFAEYVFHLETGRLETIQQMPCLRDMGLDTYDIAQALYDINDENHHWVANAMAWFALEHVAGYCADNYDEERIADCFAFPKA